MRSTPSGLSLARDEGDQHVDLKPLSNQKHFYFRKIFQHVGIVAVDVFIK